MLSDDFYVFDPVRFRFVGRSRKRIFTMGDRLEVTVQKVDLYKQQIDFQLAPEAVAASKPKKRPARK